MFLQHMQATPIPPSMRRAAHPARSRRARAGLPRKDPSAGRRTPKKCALIGSAGLSRAGTTTAPARGGETNRPELTGFAPACRAGGRLRRPHARRVVDEDLRRASRPRLSRMKSRRVPPRPGSSRCRQTGTIVGRGIGDPPTKPFRLIAAPIVAMRHPPSHGTLGEPACQLLPAGFGCLVTRRRPRSCSLSSAFSASTARQRKTRPGLTSFDAITILIRASLRHRAMVSLVGRSATRSRSSARSRHRSRANTNLQIH